MTDSLSTQSPRTESRSKAREILDGLRWHRIDPSKIKIDSTPCAKGGQGTIVLGTRIAPEDVATWVPEQVLKMFEREGELAIEKLDWNREDAEVSAKFLNSFTKQVKETVNLLAPKLSNSPVSNWVQRADKGLVSVERTSREGLVIQVSEDCLKMFLKRKLAIKKLNWSREDAEASAKDFNSFVNEVEIMASLSHPKIVEFVGFVEDMQKGDAWIILPWEENGNVREFLASGEWDIPERLSLIIDVADGVEYLHSRQPPICHGDLKSMNILVNSSYRAVITDFGSARTKGDVDPKTEDGGSEPPHQVTIDDIVENLLSPKIKFDRSTLELTLTGPGYTLRWTAPEVLSSEVQDLPSDMWALGWICWEIVTGKIPFEELRAMGPIVSKVVQGKLPAIREEADLSHILMLCGLMMDCWMSKPGERIDASMFRRKLVFIPAEPPSVDRYGGAKVRSASLLYALGGMYWYQDNFVEAESHYQSAIEVATRTKDDRANANALYGLGLVYDSQSRHREAEKAFMEAYEIWSRIGNDHGAASALHGLGRLYYAQSKYQEAEKDFMGAHKIYSRVGNDCGVADALDGLGGLYHAQSKYREAEKALMEAHEIYSRIGNDTGAANALYGLGELYRDQSKYREAEKALIEAHEIYFRIGHDRGAANALDGMGQLYRAQSKDREAEKALMEAHEIHSRIGNDLGAANALRGLGYTYYVQSKNREAEKALMEAHEIYSRIGHDLGVANVLHHLGNTYHAQSRIPEAENALNEAHKIALEAPWNRFAAAEALYRQAAASYVQADAGGSRARALLALGEDYQAQCRYSDAEEAASDSLAIFISIANEEFEGQADASILLAKIFQSQSRNNEVKEALIQAEAACAQIGPDGARAATLDRIGKIHDAQGEYDEAEECFRLAQAIFSSLDDVRGEAAQLHNLGVLYGHQNRYDEAEECLAESGVAYVRVADEEGEAVALGTLAAAYRLQHKFADARVACMQAREIHAHMGRSMSKMCAETWKILQALENVGKHVAGLFESWLMQAAL